jgi:hypothetical protein
MINGLNGGVPDHRPARLHYSGKGNVDRSPNPRVRWSKLCNPLPCHSPDLPQFTCARSLQLVNSKATEFVGTFQDSLTTLNGFSNVGCSHSHDSATLSIDTESMFSIYCMRHTNDRGLMLGTASTQTYPMAQPDIRSERCRTLCDKGRTSLADAVRKREAKLGL